MSAVFDRIRVVEGDITRLEVDAIVNAANSSLMGGGGVDGAIHRAAGPELARECSTLGGCPVGEARMTRGYGLPARWVIHTVGPVWRGGSRGEPALLASCYRSSLALAREGSLDSIAFPSISTGAYGYPVEQASRVAVQAVVSFLQEHEAPRTVTFVCFSTRDHDAYLQALAAQRGAGLP
jgi:O-acetyl-ADP-ribose deacetylase (regulator of RNase III)